MRVRDMDENNSNAQTTETPEVTKKEMRNGCLILVIIGLIIAALFQSCFGGSGDDEGFATPTPEQPTIEATPSEPELSLSERIAGAETLYEAVNFAIPTSMDNTLRNIRVTEQTGNINIYANLRSGWSVASSREGSIRQAGEVVRNLFWREDVWQIGIHFYEDLIDGFGNVTGTLVMTLRFSRETLDLVNYENFMWIDPDNIIFIADSHFIHNVLQ
jgi:hypothetical protein